MFFVVIKFACVYSVLSFQSSSDKISAFPYSFDCPAIRCFLCSFAVFFILFKESRVAYAIIIDVESKSIFHSGLPLPFVYKLTVFEQSSSSISESFKKRADVLLGLIVIAIYLIDSHSLLQALIKATFIWSVRVIDLRPLICLEHFQFNRMN